MQLRAAHGMKAEGLGVNGRVVCCSIHHYHTHTHTLQYKIDSDVRLDGRPCYVQEVRGLPEEAAQCERHR